MTGAPIDYNACVADYQSGLVDKLRGFGPAAEFLELWVPDEDIIESLCAMIDAAGAAGMKSVDVYLGENSAAQVDPHALQETVGEVASIQSSKKNDGLLLSITEIKSGPIHHIRAKEKPISEKRERNFETAALRKMTLAWRKQKDGINQAYAAALHQAAMHSSHEGELAEKDGLVTLRMEQNEAVLFLHVDPADHIIRTASHQGAASPRLAALFDRLCAVITGLPIQEAGDHGVIRLEADLRAPGSTPPVAGVISPEAADPAFGLPLRLIRRGLAQYREKTGYSVTANDYDPGPSAGWLALSDAERRKRIAQALAAAENEKGFNASDVTITAIEYDVRVVVRLESGLATSDKQHHIMKIEKILKDGVDRRLEVYQEELKDSNVIRRLSGTDEKQ